MRLPFPAQLLVLWLSALLALPASVAPSALAPGLNTGRAVAPVASSEEEDAERESAATQPASVRRHSGHPGQPTTPSRRGVARAASRHITAFAAVAASPAERPAFLLARHLVPRFGE